MEQDEDPDAHPGRRPGGYLRLCADGTYAGAASDDTPRQSGGKSLSVLIESERALDSCFDAFSCREPVSTSFESAITSRIKLKAYVVLRCWYGHPIRTTIASLDYSRIYLK